MPAFRLRSVRLRALAFSAVASLSLAACSSDPTLYSLAPTPGVSQSGGPSVVEVRTPIVSARLDRDEIVRQDRDYTLKIASGEAWSEALGNMIGHVLTRDLAQRLPGTTVFAQNDAVATKPAAYVELTVTAFNEDQNGQAVLQAMLSTHPAVGGIGPVMTLPVQLQEALPQHTTRALVAALSNMLGQAADIAAQRLRVMPSLPLPADSP
ncbi:PqiC family protein [Kozakia baliensis]|uniref:PqiC family protein n=1 Tax=Kozakia baliensis TaxID=153496 RepID=UPI000497E3CC|nr:PqiC family protein [Kozakia baliensis]